MGVGVLLAAITLLLGSYFILRNAWPKPSMKDGQKAHEMDQLQPPAEMQDTLTYVEISPPQRTLHKSIARESSLGATATHAQLE